MLFKALTSMAASRRPKKKKQPTNKTKQNKTKTDKNHRVASGESNTNSLKFHEVERKKRLLLFFIIPVLRNDINNAVTSNIGK